LLAGITLGYILFGCEVNSISNVDYIYKIDSLQVKLDSTNKLLIQSNDYVKFLESDNMMLRKGIMLEYEDLNN
jgi:ABC-type uncharacterized transport system auxiliary subunit